MSESKGLGTSGSPAGGWIEVAARRLSRRQVLSNALKGAVVAVAGLTLGELPSAAFSDATAETVCGYPNGRSCNDLGYNCPTGPGGGCPPACSVCRKPDCSPHCTYADGNWIAGNCGRCGMGFFICFDCKCKHCAGVCGCQSVCQCTGCCSPADVQREIALIKSLSVA